MRLAQLARKLAIRPSQIVDYLAAKQIFPDEGSNARLSDEVTELVVLHFAPDRLNEIMTVDEKNTEPISLPDPVVEEPVLAPVKEEVIVMAVPSLPEVVEEKIEIEVIKAPKVELSGLKVLGKIELPEPKKKTAPVVESPEGTAVTEERTEPIPVTEKRQRRPESRTQAQPRREYTPRSARNPIALQREEQARKEEEKRKARLEREKEKRTQYYLQRVKSGQPTKAAKIVSEPTESFSLKEEKPAPKTWLGKFLRWLNT
ncbi:MAG: hypothetical protein RI909_1245 [Bacteroidota bacterium]|jgi:hypothetical protein